MPDEKMRELCAKIAVEKDLAKMNVLVEQLIKLLAEEQDAIKGTIKSRISASPKTH